MKRSLIPFEQIGVKEFVDGCAKVSVVLVDSPNRRSKQSPKRVLPTPPRFR